MSEPFLSAKRFVVRMRDDKAFREGIIIHRGDPKKLAALLAAENYRFTQAEFQQALTEVDNLGSLATELRGIIFH